MFCRFGVTNRFSETHYMYEKVKEQLDLDVKVDSILFPTCNHPKIIGVTFDFMLTFSDEM